MYIWRIAGVRKYFFQGEGGSVVFESIHRPLLYTIVCSVFELLVFLESFGPFLRIVLLFTPFDQELVSYNPVTGEWTTLASMLVPRYEVYI
jgi:hypothetical protein